MRMRSSWGIGVLALCVPTLTWWLAGAPNANVAIAQTPRLLFLAVGLIGIAWATCKEDLWMFALLAYLTLSAFWVKVPGAWDAVIYLTVGAVIVQSARTTPHHWRRWLSWGLGGLGLCEVAIATSQWCLYDPIWGGKLAWAWIHGTIGNPNHLGAYLAIVAGIAPLWMLPFLAFGVFLSKAMLAAGALMVCIFLRADRRWRVPLLLCCGVGLVYLAGFRPDQDFRSWIERWEAWTLALYAWSFTPWFGLGPGSWYTLGSLAQLQTLGATQHTFLQVNTILHNDPLQLLFEGGVVGISLAGGWLWTHRQQMIASRIAPSLAALAVVSLGSFPFHHFVLASLACVVLGWSIPTEVPHGDQAKG